MASLTLEERVAALEADVAELKAQGDAGKPGDTVPWWEKIFGTFADCPIYEEAMALGRAYRESLRPSDDEADEE